MDEHYAMIAIHENTNRVTLKAIGAVLIFVSLLSCSDTAAVNTQDLAAVSVFPKRLSIAPGVTTPLLATGVDDEGHSISNPDVTWSTTNADVATISGGVVRGVSSGTAYVRAMSGSVGDSAAITVTGAQLSPTTPPVLTTVSLTPTNPTLAVGSTQTFTATARDQYGNSMAGQTFTWSSSNPSIMTVSQGVVSALAVGTATLNVSSNGISASTQVNVTTSTTLPPTGNGLIFADDFDSGALKTGGTWKNLGTNVSVIGGNTHSGSHALRFHYPGKADPCTDASAEQRFNIANLNEIWIEYWFFLPSNFAHREPAGCATSAANQKFIRVWGPSENAYSQNNPKAGASFDPINGGPDSFVYVQWGDADNTMLAGQDPLSRWNQAFTSATRGKWMLLRWHFKLASGPSATDGQVQLWVDGALKVNLQGKPFYGTTGNWFSTGYLMGWANASYAQDTDFFIDDFRIYGANPGW